MEASTTSLPSPEMNKFYYFRMLIAIHVPESRGATKYTQAILGEFATKCSDRKKSSLYRFVTAKKIPDNAFKAIILKLYPSKVDEKINFLSLLMSVDDFIYFINQRTEDAEQRIFIKEELRSLYDAMVVDDKHGNVEKGVKAKSSKIRHNFYENRSESQVNELARIIDGRYWLYHYWLDHEDHGEVVIAKRLIEIHQYDATTKKIVVNMLTKCENEMKCGGVIKWGYDGLMLISQKNYSIILQKQTNPHEIVTILLKRVDIEMVYTLGLITAETYKAGALDGSPAAATAIIVSIPKNADPCDDVGRLYKLNEAKSLKKEIDVNVVGLLERSNQSKSMPILQNIKTVKRVKRK